MHNRAYHARGATKSGARGFVAEDDAVVVGFDDADGEVFGEHFDEDFGFVGVEGAADAQVGKVFVGQDHAAFVVAVDFIQGATQGVVLEQDLALAPARDAADVGLADDGGGLTGGGYD